MSNGARVDLDARVAHRRAQCHRARAPLALLKLRLRGLAGWRERLGDALVDGLCEQLGERLRRRVRDTDEVIDQGSGRYAVLLPGALPGGVCVVEQRLQAALGAPYRLGPLLLAPDLTFERTHWAADELQALMPPDGLAAVAPPEAARR